MIDFLDLELRFLALQLHFSPVPAQLALRLLLGAKKCGYQNIGQLTLVDWQQAVNECNHSVEPIPHATWARWQESRFKAQERALESRQCCKEEGFLVYGSRAYPKPLYRLFRPPFVLFSRGSQEAMAKSSGFAVCGSRKATLQGRSSAFALAYGVCKHSDFYLVSGLSEGIELAACEGVLAAGRPAVAVLCCGLDAIAPLESLQMAARLLAAGGLLLSEYPALQPRQQYTFLQRNRILAALASSLIMAELGPKSKALNLVDYALELNHDVAVLGNSVGVQRLREQGCVHWPDAAALLKALGMECEIRLQRYEPGREIGELVADSIYEELLQQRQYYLGRRVGEN